MSSTKRSAFTLIEILVVIAIIAVLASLLLGAVMMVRGKGPELQTRNDILQLGAALDRFYTDHKFYPPDRIKLHDRRADYNMGIPLDQKSVEYISAIWPNLKGTATTGNWVNVRWHGRPTALPGAGYTLEGDQCLVFFLGGPPDGTTGKLLGGFSVNPLDPIQLPPSQQLDRKKYYDFDPGRLSSRGGSPFLSFYDPYKKQPYVYFSSYKAANGYEPAWWSTTPNTLLVNPYIEKAANAATGQAAKYWNSTKFQIISAGQDGVFGPGGLWPSGVVAGIADDTSNFHDRKLGSP